MATFNLEFAISFHSLLPTLHFTASDRQTPTPNHQPSVDSLRQPHARGPAMQNSFNRNFEQELRSSRSWQHIQRWCHTWSLNHPDYRLRAPS